MNFYLCLIAAGFKEHPICLEKRAAAQFHNCCVLTILLAAAAIEAEPEKGFAFLWFSGFSCGIAPLRLQTSPEVPQPSHYRDSDRHLHRNHRDTRCHPSLPQNGRCRRLPCRSSPEDMLPLGYQIVKPAHADRHYVVRGNLPVIGKIMGKPVVALQIA